MDPTPELIDAIYREKVERARRVPPERRMRIGPELYDRWRMLVEGSVHTDDPNATGEDVIREIDRRLRIARRLEETDAEGKPLFVERKP